MFYIYNYIIDNDLSILMIWDGVITPAISILSAVEGMVLIPWYEETSKFTLLLISAIIAFVLFVVQKKGVENKCCIYSNTIWKKRRTI